MAPPGPIVKYLPYTLLLKSPALLTGFAGDPNSASSLGFIPGSAIRGVVASLILSRSGRDAEEQLHTLILSGRVRYLHAYLQHEATRTLPTPANWRAKKGERIGTVVDLAAFTGDLNDETEFDFDEDGIEIEPSSTWPTETLDRSVPPFIAFSGSSRTGLAPERGARVHLQRDREMGRSWKKDDSETRGALYAYEYLEGNQFFRGFVQIVEESEERAKMVTDLVRGLLEQSSILLGRSRRGGYGGSAQLEFETPSDFEVNWGDRQNDDLKEGDTFRAYLLSDCISRDPLTGQVDPLSLLDELTLRLGGDSAIDAGSVRPFWDFITVGGFNRKWRLALPQASAIKSGSMIVLKARTSLSRDVLRRIEHEGLGERRIEGFGRLVFLKDRKTREVRLSAPGKSEVPSYPSGRPPGTLNLLQKRILDEAVSRAIDDTVRSLLIAVTKPPSRSLIGRLRHCLRQPCQESALEQLSRLLSQSEEGLKKDALDKLRECKLRQERLVDWLCKGVARDLDQVLSPELRRKSRLVERADDPWLSDIIEANRARYKVQLIDNLLARLARESRRQERAPYVN